MTVVGDQRGAKHVGRPPLASQTKATPSEGYNGPREADSVMLEDMDSAGIRPFTPQQNNKQAVDDNDSMGKVEPMIVQRSDNEISEM